MDPGLDGQQPTGKEFRIFGQDGSGGYAALWLVRQGSPVLEQPVVFFGSEGELGVVASNVHDYLWLLAGGLGPCEAVCFPSDDHEPDAVFTKFAEEYAPAHKKTARAVLAAAQNAFPNFERDFRALCR